MTGTQFSTDKTPPIGQFPYLMLEGLGLLKAVVLLHAPLLQR